MVHWSCPVCTFQAQLNAPSKKGMVVKYSREFAAVQLTGPRRNRERPGTYPPNVTAVAVISSGYRNFLRQRSMAALIVSP